MLVTPFRIKTVLTLTLVLAVLQNTSSLKCIDTCFENCSLPECSGKGGFLSPVPNAGGPFRLPGNIGVECDRPGDKCAYKEFTSIRGNGVGMLSVTTPAGCLFEYVDVNDRVNNWDLSLGTNLFSCEGDFCNVPPK